MTNTQQITMSQEGATGGTQDMHGWTEQNQMVIRSRIREREAEAASERLAVTARDTTRSSPRRAVGRLLIRVGRRIAGEPVATGAPAAQPAQRMAA
jgi:hypothetical protein